MKKPRRKRAPKHTRESLWPSRGQCGLAKAAFALALGAPARAITIEQAPAKPDRPADPIAALIAAGVRLVQAVGMPDLFHPDSKHSTLIEVSETGGRPQVDLFHRKLNSEDRLREAADALAEMLELVGRKVIFRDVSRARTVGGWRATLRLAPLGGPVMVRAR